MALAQGKPTPMGYTSTFFINWPEHLGGGTANLVLEGTMLLVPLLSTE